MSISLTGQSEAARRQRYAILEAQKLQDQAYKESAQQLDPWAQYERSSANNFYSQANVPFEESYYMTSVSDIPENPLYKALQQAGIDATQIGLSGQGGLYGGNATEAYSDVGRNAFMQTYGANISNYDKYLGTLQQMASPQVTTNLANMRMGNASQMGQYGMAAADTYMSTANSRQAMLGDLVQAGAMMGGAALGVPSMPQIPNQQAQQPQMPAPMPQKPSMYDYSGMQPQQSYLPQKPSIYNF